MGHRQRHRAFADTYVAGLFVLSAEEGWKRKESGSLSEQKGENKGMLQFLEAGYGVYVVAAICVLGILSKCMLHGFYRSAIKQTDNMAATRNRFLKGFRQRTENTYWINQGIYNARAYIERQVFGYRFMGISLDGWDGLAGQAVLLSLIAGGIGAYASYWYQLDSSYIVLYGAAAALGALAVLFVDQSVKTGQRREQLVLCLQDYIENSMGRRAANRMEKEEKDAGEQPKDNVIVSLERGMSRNKTENGEGDKMLGNGNRMDGRADSWGENGADGRGTAWMGNGPESRGMVRMEGGMENRGLNRMEGGMENRGTGRMENGSETRGANRMENRADSRMEKEEVVRKSGISMRRGAAMAKRRMSRVEQEPDEAEMMEENGRRSSTSEIENLRKSIEQAAAGKEKNESEKGVWI